MSRHTPGPWRASFKSKRSNNLGIYNDAGILLADVPVHQIASAAAIERRTHDADLIAAAPDLLEALKAMEAAAQSTDPQVQAKASQSCRAAIAKATGGA